LLDLIERGEEHLPRLDARGIDVLLPDEVQRLVDGEKTRQIVGGLLGARSRDGMGRTEPLPKCSAKFAESANTPRTNTKRIARSIRRIVGRV
jgi:hypothetical protein